MWKVCNNYKSCNIKQGSETEHYQPLAFEFSIPSSYFLYLMSMKRSIPEYSLFNKYNMEPAVRLYHADDVLEEKVLHLKTKPPLRFEMKELKVVEG